MALHDIRATYKVWCALNVASDLIGNSALLRALRDQLTLRSHHITPLHALGPSTSENPKSDSRRNLLPGFCSCDLRHHPHRRIPSIRHLLRRCTLVKSRSHRRRHRRFSPTLSCLAHQQREGKYHFSSQPSRSIQRHQQCTDAH